MSVNTALPHHTKTVEIGKYQGTVWLRLYDDNRNEITVFAGPDPYVWLRRLNEALSETIVAITADPRETCTHSRHVMETKTGAAS